MSAAERMRYALLALLLVCLPLSAQLRLSLDERGLNPAERQASQALIEQALNALPPSFIERLDRRVELRWSDGLREDAFGSTVGPYRIELNRRLLGVLADGSAAERRTGRPHGTLERELLATLLHELLHPYHRARFRRQGAAGLPDACRGQTERRFTLSDQPRLLDLAGWPQRVGRRGERETDNGQISRSPDPYELVNPREFVAVNFEYFLLDPEYGCRRPALDRHFRQHFGWQPAGRADCERDLAYLSAGL